MECIRRNFEHSSVRIIKLGLQGAQWNVRRNFEHSSVRRIKLGFKGAQWNVYKGISNIHLLEEYMNLVSHASRHCPCS